jgi:hypothetical protein
MISNSQRISPDTLIDCLMSTFRQGAINEFKTFMGRHPDVTKWVIATDFVVKEPQATSDAYAYTLFPYNLDFLGLKSKIANLVPNDFKDVKNVPQKLCAFLHSAETFTFCLLTPKNYNAAGDIRTVRSSLDYTIKMMKAWEGPDARNHFIEAFEQLRQRANANSFSPRFMSRMMIATVLAAFCAVILAQERNIEIVGWFPDRDNITTAYDRIADAMFAVNFSAFCQRFSVIEWRSIKTVVGLPEGDPDKPKQMWYDELVRIPDFVAGPLASWNYTDKLVPGRQKYVDILMGAVADNPYLVTLLFQDREEGVGVSRLLCSKAPLPGLTVGA